MPQANRLSLPSAPVKRQLENRQLWNDGRTADDADFFTLGYSGRTTEDMVAALLAHDVRTLVDVRQNAISMYRPDLSKQNLQRIMEVRKIQYVHVPDLGVPRDIRAKAIASGSRKVIWDWYDVHVTGALSLHRFMNSYDHKVAMMCTEIDPTECHRHRLFLALEALGLRGFEL